MLWTLGALLMFLIMSQIPLYGVASSGKNDPFYWLRVVMASNRGTLMELGISPIVTSSMIMQLIMGGGLIRFDRNSKRDRELFNAACKVFGILISFGEATAYVLSGM